MRVDAGEVTSSRRGRPTVERAAGIDAQIMASALALFAEVGFEAVSMEAVAQAAGVSKGTLYARHASKAELLRALMADRIAAWSRTAGADDRLLPPDLKGRLRAHAATIRSARHWNETRQMQRLVRAVAREFPELAMEWHQLTTGSFLSFLAQEIVQAAAHDGFPNADGTFLAKLFLHALGGWTEAEETTARFDEEAYQAFADRLIAAVVLAASAGVDAPTKSRHDLRMERHL